MNNDTLSMGRMDYINASPVYYGLNNGLAPSWIKMTDGPPAVLNRMIHQGELAISPISSGFYGLHHRELLVLPDLSISCRGPVLSVNLMGNLPIEELDNKKVVLTEDSATSALLVRLIFAEQGIAPRFSTHRMRTPGDIPEGTDAVLVIGDAALTQPWDDHFKYRLDLGELWHRTTGLPFVFALWVVRRDYARKYPEKVSRALALFHQSRRQGYDNIDTVIDRGVAKLKLSRALIKEYYEVLHCNLDEEKIIALERYFEGLYNHGLFTDRVKVELFQP
ncbi:MAG: menaquinone biosynthesis protein [Desulfobacteraceae bacterium]|nr:menaquinone biosynthesis protein [Desulfobacteraceae bacterium]